MKKFFLGFGFFVSDTVSGVVLGLIGPLDLPWAKTVRG